MNAIENHARSIFLSAVQRGRDEWPVFLDQACGADADLRDRVDQLLEAHLAMGSIDCRAGAAPAATVDDCPVRECAGSLIGPYKLLEQIGEGGFGIVFMAEQTRPLCRKVALKVLKPGMDTRQVIARFEAERQALALMDHPNIAHVHDGGETASGRPYFVMELVEGIPITEFCDQSQLSVRQRLELFLNVCQAAQHAHQKGIIHRDIKPGNVMVTLHDGTPVVKVIDFGIAKATGQRLTDKTLFTGFAQMIGTPLYMSPEQAALSGLDVDTRSDIYSLGVLFYELLTGTTPFDKERLSQVGYDEMRRIIREEEPPRPSTRISTLGQAATTVATQRKSDPKRLSQLCRGELDWIVMKALEKDRNRRYDTASAFAADVERYLHDEPVQACPPSAWYRWRKFARRNKARLAIMGLILWFLVFLGSGLGWVMRDRAARREVGNQRAQDALAEAARLVAAEKWSAALSFLGQAEAILTSSGGSSELSDQAGRLRLAVETARSLDDARIKMAAGKKDHRFDWGAGDAAYAAAFEKYGLDVDNLDLHAAADAIRASPISWQLIAALDDWAFIRRDWHFQGWERRLALARLADPHPWRNRLRDVMERKDVGALEQAIQMASPDDWQSAIVLLGRLTEHAPPMRERAVALLRRAQQRHPDDFWINIELAGLLYQLQPSRLEEAAHYTGIAVALRPQSPGARNNLGAVLYQLGKRDEGIAEYHKAIELDPGFAGAYCNLGVALNDQGKRDAAIAAYQKAIELAPRHFGAHNNLGHIFLGQGKRDEAIAEFHKAIAINPRFWNAYHNLGMTLAGQDKLDEAVVALRKAIDLNPKFADNHCELGIVLGRFNKVDQSIAEFQKAIALGLNHARLHNNFGASLARKRRLDEAIAEFQKAIKLEPNNAAVYINLGRAFATKADALYTKDQLDEAIVEYRKAVANDPDNFAAHLSLGAALLRLGHPDEAIAECRKALAINPKKVAPHVNIGNALSTKGRPDEAIAEYRKALAIDPKCANAHLGVAGALLQQGRFADACAGYRRCLKLLRERDPLRAAVLQQAQQAQRWLDLEPKLLEVLAGKVQPASGAERLEFALLASIKKLHAGAARLYAEGFAADPKRADDPRTQDRYNAACAAALAGCAKGVDAANTDEKERARLRRQALDWLRADLSAWGQLVQKRPLMAHATVLKTLRHWQQDTDFDGVRGDALAKLPEPERRMWQQLWADVEQTLRNSSDKGAKDTNKNSSK
jgi:tetratricopeptide (TPR) repeat protein/serine/threonine protein kinase